MTIRTGVIGMGYMGELHARIYQSLPNAELVGVVEVNPERKGVLEHEFGVPVYQDLAELLRQVDAVSVCTPDNLHLGPVLEAFHHKVKVLVEKPLCTSLEEGTAMLEASPDETYLMVGHLLRYDPRLAQCREAVRSGRLGKLSYVKMWRHGTVSSGQKHGLRSSVSWFLGIHDMDLLLWITGLNIRTVSAVGRIVHAANWDVVHTQIELENDVLATVENSWLLPVERGSDLDAGIKVIGERGMVEVNLSHTGLAVSVVDEQRQMYPDTYHWPLVNGVPDGDLRREVEDFVVSVAANRTPLVTGEVGLAAVKGISLVEQSLRTGQKVYADGGK